ncbi:alpha/beta fold hydrolase [Hamadaea sp. NPDC051192]|uniref:alpha/beta fold hydrolase n=1 Tax=Hamadaea sp. NPDC051192 TaxID=3154940 RepID=UPI003415D9F3
MPLRTLERTDVDSDTLIVFLHGLGLDAEDYLPYLRESHQRCVAVTLYGFDRGSTQDLEPATFEQHAEYLSALLAELQREHPAARLVLVGFSLGADMIIRLADYWSHHAGEPARIASAVLLDPNINHSTMTISRVLANANPDDPLADLKRIATLPASMASFQAIITYLGKILGKDMRHLHRLSTDAVNYWQPDGYELFGKRLATVKHFADHIRVLLSDDYQPHLNALQDFQDERLSFAIIPGSDHFDLIDIENLTQALDHPMPAPGPDTRACDPRLTASVTERTHELPQLTRAVMRY